jgi:SprT protein
MQKEEIQKHFENYVPPEFAAYCADLLVKYGVHIKVKAPRNTKAGDYRPPVNGRKYHEVTVNEDLNPYYFLLVYLHEMAHVTAWIAHGRNHEPHGKEWKAHFWELTLPVLQSDKLPPSLKTALKRFFIKTPATFIADTALHKVLSSFDTQKSPVTHLNELPFDSLFSLNNGLVLQKKSQLRTWFMCEDPKSGKKYRVRGNAEVTLLS